MRHRNASVSLAALFLSLVLAAGAQAAERAKMVFGFSTIGAMAAGAWMAKEIGAFERNGIDAELIYISSGPVVVQALLGGDLQAGLAATNATIAAVLRGAQLVSVMSTANRPYHRLFVQPEINKLEDLRGKVLGVTRFGAVTDNLTRILLKKHGLENAVSLRQLGGTMEVSAAFQHKQIAGAVTSTLRVDAQTKPKLLLKLEDMGIQYSMDVIVVSRDYLKRNAATVEAMTRAYTEGVAAMHRDKPTSLRAIARFARIADPRLIEEIYQDSVVYLEKVPRLTPEATTPILESMGKKDVPMETFADNSIVDRLVREKFIEKLYQK
ncbi:MAG TPA: ABC transporter substrate-binding protein [Candidatus Binatia bacterium]|jgi:ABC-type nitrate/sulfonate/bicarbonate transport system substrate-binding protein